VTLVAVAALAAPLPGAHAALQRDVLIDIDEAGPVDVDLDGNDVAEQVSAPVLSDGFLRRPTLAFGCSGATRTRAIGRTDERVAIEALRVRGKTGPPLLTVFGSSGATGRIQNTRAHRLLPGACPRLRTVFRFPHRTARTPRPPRGTAPGSFSSSPREVRGAIWFRTTEGLYRRNDPGCCPSYIRTIDWRPRGGGYVRVKTRVRKLPRP
jgi:hypothetical protein